MAKQQTQRIGLVQVDVDVDTSAPRDPLREALAQAIQNYAALKQALASTAASAQRAEDARFDASKAFDAANKALEEAKVADSEAIAAGTPIGAVKTARASLQEAEDQLEAARGAIKILAEQHTDLTNRLSIAESRVHTALAAVVCADPATRNLIERFRAAQLALHETREVMRVLMPLFPHASNTAAWEQSGLPTHIRFWDSSNWERDLSSSQIAARVQEWLVRLRTDPSAVLSV
jgi:hypothetical protein